MSALPIFQNFCQRKIWGLKLDHHYQAEGISSGCHDDQASCPYMADINIFKHTGAGKNSPEYQGFLWKMKSETVLAIMCIESESIAISRYITCKNAKVLVLQVIHIVIHIINIIRRIVICRFSQLCSIKRLKTSRCHTLPRNVSTISASCQVNIF